MASRQIKDIEMLQLSVSTQSFSKISAFLLLVSAVLLLETSYSVARADALWEQHYGGGKRDKAFAIKSLKDGGSIVSGYTRSGSQGDSDVWVMKLDSAGKSVWEKTFGGVGREVSTGVTNLKGGGFMVVAYSQDLKTLKKDAWLIRLDEDGNKLWDKKYQGAKSGRPYAVLAMSDGGVVVAGLTFKDDKAKNYDGWVFRVDKTGKKKWERILGSKGKDWLRSLAKLPNGDIIAVGAQQYHIVKAALTPTSSVSKKGVQAAWAMRLKPNGKTVWDKTFFSNENVARSVVIQKNGNIAVAGWTRGGASKYGKDTWIVSLSPKGNIIWKKSFGGAGEDKTDGITVLADGTLALACITEKHFPMMTVNSAWILAIDNKGSILWERPYGNGRADQVHAITTLTDGRIAVAGGTWRSGKGTDAWVFTLDKTGKAPKIK